jgi:hypothetical protein
MSHVNILTADFYAILHILVSKRDIIMGEKGKEEGSVPWVKCDDVERKFYFCGWSPMSSTPE